MTNHEATVHEREQAEWEHEETLADRRRRRFGCKALVAAMRVSDVGKHRRQREMALVVLGRAPRMARERRAVARYAMLRDADLATRCQRRLTRKLRRYREYKNGGLRK